MDNKNQTEVIQKGRFTITKNKIPLKEFANKAFDEKEKNEKEFLKEVKNKLDNSFVERLKKSKKDSKNQSFGINI